MDGATYWLSFAGIRPTLPSRIMRGRGRTSAARQVFTTVFPKRAPRAEILPVAQKSLKPQTGVELNNVDGRVLTEILQIK